MCGQFSNFCPLELHSFFYVHDNLAILSPRSHDSALSSSIKLLENGLKAPNITPDKYQPKHQLSWLVISGFLFQLWCKCWVREHCSAQRPRQRHRWPGRISSVCLDSPGQHLHQSQRNSLEITFTWTDDTETGFSCVRRHDSKIMDAHARTIHEPELKSLPSVCWVWCWLKCH